MKIDRLIGILSVLLQEEKTTAPKLAERFEVSRRTINRDIEDLCKAGIPVRTIQGTGGGIRIMDGYRMDRTILTSKDMQMILAGLRSLDSVSGSRYYSRLMEKLQAGSSEFVNGRDSMLIDLSSWYKGTLAPKIETIQDAIENRRLLDFRYYAPSGESARTIEPYYLVFKWTSWYVWGWCMKRKDFRLFKLNRMDQATVSGKTFVCREVPMPDLSNEKIFPGGIRVKALFDSDVKWRLVEEFGPHCFTEMNDGRLLFQADYTDMENLLTWILTFGEKAEVLEPVEVRERICDIADAMRKTYRRKQSMRYEWVDEYLMKKTGVTRDLQKDWNWMRYQIGGKMFAAVCRDEKNRPYYITLKLEPMEGDFLRGQYEDIIPGYYMNKMHWNSVKADGKVPDELLKDLLDKSYWIVLGSLSRKKQREILETAQKDDLISCREDGD